MSLFFTINISTSQLEDFFLLTPEIPFVWCSFEAFSKREQEKDLFALLTFSSRPSPKNVFSFKLCLKKKNDLFQLSAGGKKQTLKSHFL